MQWFWWISIIILDASLEIDLQHLIKCRMICDIRVMMWETFRVCSIEINSNEGRFDLVEIRTQHPCKPIFFNHHDSWRMSSNSCCRYDVTHPSRPTPYIFIIASRRQSSLAVAIWFDYLIWKSRILVHSLIIIGLYKNRKLISRNDNWKIKFDFQSAIASKNRKLQFINICECLYVYLNL